MIALVNQTPKFLSTGGSATKTITIPAPSAGNALFLLVRESSGHPIVSVSGGGVTWSNIAISSNSSGSTACEIWAGPNSSGSGTTVSITYASAYTGGTDATVVEISGLGSALTLDPATGLTSSGRTASAATPSITPTSGDSQIQFTIAGSNGTITNSPTGGFTALTIDSGGSGLVGWGYQIVSSASGSYSSTFTVAHSYDYWATIIAAFDGSGGSPPAGGPFPHYTRRRMSGGMIEMVGGMC